MLKEICLFFFSPKNISNSQGHEFDEIQWFSKEGKKTSFKYFEGYFTRFYSTNLGPTKTTKTPV